MTSFGNIGFFGSIGIVVGGLATFTVNTIALAVIASEAKQRKELPSAAFILTATKAAEIFLMLFFLEETGYGAGLSIGAISMSFINSALLLRLITKENKSLFESPTFKAFALGGVLAAMSVSTIGTIPALILGNFVIYNSFKAITKNVESLKSINLNVDPESFIVFAKTKFHAFFQE